MSRLQEHAAAKPGWFARFVYFVTRRKLGRVPVPVRLLHGNGALLAGYGAFETALQHSHAVPDRIKSLVQIRVAMLVGCPF